jgi:hypothetical protein
MSQAKYFRQKKKIENMKLDRMHHIAKFFPDQHLERIDRCELVEKLMWDNYHQCKDQAKKVKILESTVNVQPFLSGYYEATKVRHWPTGRQTLLLECKIILVSSGFFVTIKIDLDF